MLWKLDHLEAVLESLSSPRASSGASTPSPPPPASSLRAGVQVAKLSPLNLGNVCYDDFHSRFSTSKGGIFHFDISQIVTAFSMDIL